MIENPEIQDFDSTQKQIKDREQVGKRGRKKSE